MMMPASVIHIRNAAPADIDAMAGLLRELFSIEVDFAADIVRQRKGLFLMLDGCMKHKIIKVADAEGKIVGMAAAQTLISTAEGGVVALVEDVVVKTGWRGQGIGGLLIESIKKWAEDRGVTRLQLLADRDNRPALEFYEKKGWRGTRLVCLRYTL